MDNLSRRLLQASCAVALTAALANPAAAQSTRKDLKTGNKFFEQDNYRAAIPYYEKVLAKDPNNAKALFNAGISYMSFDKEKASDYIYKAQKIKPKVDKSVEYWLGRVDHLNYNFDEAVAHFQAYNATLKKNDQRKEELSQLIQHSKNAKIQFNSPKDIFVKNLGPTVNTQYSEHSPVISSDDKTLIFTSRGESVTGATGKVSDTKNKSIAADGEYYEDIFETTRVDDENWQKPRSLSGVLNGKETAAGGTIIMPIDISTAATTRSMIRNGKNTRNPISKARCTSLSRNDGTKRESGASIGAPTSPGRNN